jgi:hypothetical protein
VFDRVTFDFSLFRNATLARVEAMGARLNYGKFDGGWDPSIAGLRLDNAQMQGFRFVCGTSASDGCAFDRKQLSLRGANLAGASISTFSLWDAALDGIRLDQTEISVDQITQFTTANVTGPVLVRIDQKRVTLTPDALAAAARAITATKVEDTRCAEPDTTLDMLFCRAGQAELRAQRDDIERLYQSTQEPQRAADGTTIIVRAANATQQKYLKSLRNCARRDGEVALGCLAKTLAKRRGALITELLTRRPLESEARAIFVSPQTPLVQAIMREPKLAGLMPLVIDASPHLLMAYRDDDDVLIAHGIGMTSGGTKRCAAAFSPPTAKSRKTKGIAASFSAWATGAEFTIADAAPVKKKKPRKNQVEVPAAAPLSSCGQIIQSGPLVRIPVTEDDFDRLWTTRKSRI